MSDAKFRGPLWVAVAALLWATDALFRTVAIQRLDSIQVVFIEHLVSLFFIGSACLFLRINLGTSKLNRFEWLGLVLVGAGGSAAATVLFTQSFRYTNPSVSILLQKLQPVLVLLLAYLFLGERLKERFYLWAILALIAGLGVSFPGFEFGIPWKTLVSHSDFRGPLCAVAAAALWALCTVVGKKILGSISPIQMTFWRFAFGLLALSLALGANQGFPQIKTFEGYPQLTISLLYMSLVPGLISMQAYYRGLSQTPASIVTLVELVFPVSAVVLNTVFLKSTLSWGQGIAGAVLIFSVTRLSLSE